MVGRLCLLLLIFPASAAAADESVVLAGESSRTARRLEEAADAEKEARAAGRWAELLDDLQAIVNAAGNDLVPAQGRSVPARWLCHARLASLPAAALEQYRLRFENQARKWLDEGARARDPVVLRRVVEDFFCSRSAEAALDLLGDLAFERGDFAEARRWWGYLLPARDVLAYPGPKTDPALTEAKILLARWFAADLTPVADAPGSPWREEVASFRRRHPKTEGHLAGSRGVLWQRLLAVADEGPPAGSAEAGWSTFAGGPLRQHVLAEVPPERLARLLRLGDAERYRLDGAEEGRPEAPTEVQRPPEFARSLAFHPVVAEGQVLYADARRVFAVDARTGRRQVWFDADKLVGPGLELKLPAPPDLRYTLSAGGDCVLARLGVQGLRSDRGADAKDGASVVVCLNIKPNGEGRRLRWQATPDTPGAVFEGAPLVVGGRAYVAVTRFANLEAQTSIVCYPLDAAGVPPLRWKQDVCTSRELAPGQVRHRHHLLTAAGSQVVYCSHSGAIVSLDAATGRRAWAVRYDRGRADDEDGRTPPRDLAPCLSVDGRVYCAPADSDDLFCLDAVTGHTLWKRDRIEVGHLLGVGKGRLIFTTWTPRAGLRAVDAATGSDRGGWFRSGEGSPVHTLGRGLLAGDLVYWPTLHRVHVVRQEDGEQPDDPTLLDGIPPGNVALGDGILAVADRLYLHVFVPGSLRLEQRKGAARQAPGSALAQLRLGAALAEAGHPEAGEALERAARLGGPLTPLVHRERHALLSRAALDAVRRKRWEDAPELIKRALAEEFPAPWRLRSLREWCDACVERGDQARAAAACLRILRETLDEGCHLKDDRGNPQTASRWATDRLDELVRDFPEADAVVEQAFPPINRKGPGLMAAANWCPRAEWMRPRLAELARWQEATDRVASAARTWRTVLRVGEGDSKTVARARQAITLLTPRLALPSPALPSLPVSRAWERRLPPGGRFLVEEPGRPDRLYSAWQGAGPWLAQHDVVTGEPGWKQDLEFPVTWVGRYAGLLLAGGPRGVMCLEEQDGRALWQYPAPPAPDSGLSGFAVGDGLLYFMQGDARLFALDVDSGRVVWTRRAPASFLRWPDIPGRFGAELRLHGRVLTLSRPRWHLDAVTGDLLGEDAAEDPRVSFFDPGSGKLLWRHGQAGETLHAGRAPALVPVDRSSALILRWHNHAGVLERVGTNGPVWPRTLLFRTGPPAPGGLTHDADACYFDHDGELMAVSLDEGKLLWRRPLPGRGLGWRTLPVGDYLLAWPGEERRLRFSVPGPFRPLEWELVLPAAESADGSLPVLLCDRKTGELVQRLNLPGSPLRAAMAWPGKPSGDEVRPQLRASSAGLLVVAGDRAWGLKSK